MLLEENRFQILLTCCHYALVTFCAANFATCNMLSLGDFCDINFATSIAFTVDSFFALIMQAKIDTEVFCQILTNTNQTLNCHYHNHTHFHVHLFLIASLSI